MPMPTLPAVLSHPASLILFSALQGLQRSALLACRAEGLANIAFWLVLQTNNGCCETILQVQAANQFERFAEAALWKHGHAVA